MKNTKELLIYLTANSTELEDEYNKRNIDSRRTEEIKNEVLQIVASKGLPNELTRKAETDKILNENLEYKELTKNIIKYDSNIFGLKLKKELLESEMKLLRMDIDDKRTEAILKYASVLESRQQ
jgi:hypothetical protein